MPMTSFATDDLSHTSANAVLMARATKAIAGAIRGQAMDERNQRVVASAAEFLSKLVEGSLLVENKEVQGFAPSHESLREYVRALSALQQLKLVSANADSAQMFVNYHKGLLRLAAGENVSPDELRSLRSFFGALSSFFFADLTRPLSEERGDRLHNER
jgi:hypothetical protein